MEHDRYIVLKRDLEVYFAGAIKKRFKDYVDENTELHFAADIFSHNLINELLSTDGFSVYGINVNMDGFQVLLNFHRDYGALPNFIFTRLSVDFKSDGNYTVYLGEKSFMADWDAYLDDEFLRFTQVSEAEFLRLLADVKNEHLTRCLKV
jgi:hypothetical protein